MSENVDLHLGKRLRRRRRLMGLSLSDLGGMCGVSFQQIQKYECAANHMSAAMIWRISGALGVGVQYFYEGLVRERSAVAVSDAKGRTGQPAICPAINQMDAVS